MRTGVCWSNHGVNVAVTNVDARNVKFDIKVDDQPKP